MINQFGPHSHGGHLGVARVLAKLQFARERVRKLWGLMAARRKDVKEDRGLTQNHSSTHPGADDAVVVRTRAGRGLAVNCLSCSRRASWQCAERKLWLRTLTTLGLHLECPITIQLGNDWSFGCPVIISHLDNCTGFLSGPHMS